MSINKYSIIRRIPGYDICVYVPPNEMFNVLNILLNNCSEYLEEICIFFGKTLKHEVIPLEKIDIIKFLQFEIQKNVFNKLKFCYDNLHYYKKNINLLNSLMRSIDIYFSSEYNFKEFLSKYDYYFIRILNDIYNIHTYF